MGAPALGDRALLTPCGSGRTSTIPAGKKLFFPVINYIDDYPCPDPTFAPAAGQSLQDFLTHDAASIEDAVTAVTMTVDGVSVDGALAYRAHSGLFTFTGDISNQANDACITGMPQQAVTDATG